VPRRVVRAAFHARLLNLVSPQSGGRRRSVDCSCRLSLVAEVERGPLVARAFQTVGLGDYTASDVLRKMTALGVRTRKGRPLTPQTFTVLLKRRIYVGIIDAPGLGIRGIPRGFRATRIRVPISARSGRAEGAQRSGYADSPDSRCVVSSPATSVERR
jgi:hypothetical protein